MSILDTLIRLHRKHQIRQAIGVEKAIIWQCYVMGESYPGELADSEVRLKIFEYSLKRLSK